ncbi:MAG: ABC transporter ATP-binding protein [Atopobiaceae bacterium]|jgi:peptide/nickel transport system ATP-binding protein
MEVQVPTMQSQEDALLEVRGLKTTFKTRTGAVEAVRDLDLTLYRGEILAVVGESGSGKSVGMKSIMGITPKNAQVEAEVLSFNHKDMLVMSDEERRAMRGAKIAMISQDPMTSLDPVKTIGSHLFEVLKRHRNLEGEKAHHEAIKMLDTVGIPSPERRLTQYPQEFSGGMRQRVLIAMALCCEPDLLIADEPTTALDVTIQAQILELLQEIRDTRGMSIILITHDLGVVASLCDRVVVMYGGMELEEGTVEDIFYRPQHPYTRALLRAIPSPQHEGERLESIPGTAASLIDPPKECPFAQRCNFSCDACRQGIPHLQSLSSKRASRCIFTSDQLDKMEVE